MGSVDEENGREHLEADGEHLGGHSVAGLHLRDLILLPVRRSLAAIVGRP